jgi:uncharacterized protein (TIGR03643 family)
MLPDTDSSESSGKMMKKTVSRDVLSEALISEAIAMAWADDVSFDRIKEKLGLSEPDTIRLMRTHLKPTSFRLWRKRVSGRKTKHAKLLRPENS